MIVGILDKDREESYFYLRGDKSFRTQVYIYSYIIQLNGVE